MATHPPLPVKRHVHGDLPRVRHLLAVCAHPDDESFGLGAAGPGAHTRRP
ncbi:MAG TPA: hypothetical protein VFE42_34280 [Chloroflexota bacterium]|nr:hypothetical protein [Chloroflexota bacterium]